MVVKSLSFLADVGSEKPVITAIILATVILFTWLFQRIAYRLYLHPLSKYPGPTAAAVTTTWKAYVKCVLNRSFSHVLRELHAQYGMSVPTVRRM